MAGKWVSSGSLANVWTIPYSEGGLDADTLAWVAAVVANGGSVSAARQIIVNDLIVGLKADGLWTILDRLWLFAAENEPSALTDIVARVLATAVNAPTFTADNGYTGDGATNYIDSNFNPSTAGGNFVRDSACWFLWSNTSAQKAGSSGLITDPGVRLLPRFVDDNCYWSINQGTSGDSFANAAGTTGLYLLNRTGANAASIDINAIEADTDAVASTAVANSNFAALHGGVGGSNYWAGQACCLGFGGGLSAGERTAIYDRLRTYMTAVGVP